MSSNKLTNLKDGTQLQLIVYTLYAAMRNEELIEGRGRDIVQSYHRTAEDAKIACHGIDVQGTDGKVRPIKALELFGGSFLVGFTEVTPNRVDRQKLRREALAKLSPAEKEALGLEEKSWTKHRGIYMLRLSR